MCNECFNKGRKFKLTASYWRLYLHIFFFEMVLQMVDGCTSMHIVFVLYGAIPSIPLILTLTHSTGQPLHPFNLELMEQRLCSRPTVGCQHIERLVPCSAR